MSKPYVELAVAKCSPTAGPKFIVFLKAMLAPSSGQVRPSRGNVGLLVAMLAPFWDQLRPSRGPWWCYVGSVRGIQLRHRQKPPPTIPPKRCPPWPSRRNRINIIQIYVSKKLIPMAGTAKRSGARLKQRALYEYDVFAEIASSNAAAPLARPAPQAVWADFVTRHRFELTKYSKPQFVKEWFNMIRCFFRPVYI